MDKIIDKYYENNNFPSSSKLYKILKDDNISVSKRDVETYISSLEEVQITKEIKAPKKNGHITAMSPNQIWQIDLFILQKFVKQNRGYRNIFCVIDVFSRKVYCVAMKTKDIEDCTYALDSIIKKSGVKPMSIMSDNDSSFKGGLFQALLKKHEISHDMNIVGDHNALGIVDRFARTIKTVLTKLFIRTKKTNWIDTLDKIVDRYNEMPHTGILDIKPNDAENQIKPLVELNIEKGKNKITSDLEEGDKVRINIRSTFDKGTAPRWSDEVFVVQSAIGLSITLTNGIVQKREQLLKVSKETVVEQVKPNAIKKASVENKKERILKEEGVEVKNIVKKSRRKPIVASKDINGDVDINNIVSGSRRRS